MLGGSAVTRRRVLAGALALLVLAALIALAVQSVQLQSRVDSLSDDLAQVRSGGAEARRVDTRITEIDDQIAALEDKAGDIEGQIAEMGDLTEPRSYASQLKLIRECLPELNDQIYSLTVEGEFPDYYVSIPASVSRHCQRVLTPAVGE